MSQFRCSNKEAAEERPGVPRTKRTTDKPVTGEYELILHEERKELSKEQHECCQEMVGTK
jgi:hypothetical protein